MKKTILIKWNRMRKFGVELEFTAERPNNREYLKSCIAEALREHNINDQYVESRNWEHTSNNYNTWVCKTDSSCGYEVCTPPLQGPNDLKILGYVVDKFREKNVPFNNSCGLHVHLSLEDFSQEQMETMLMYWTKIEHNIMNAHPIHRQENHRYCPRVIHNIKDWSADIEYTGNQLYNKIRRFRGTINVSYWERRKTVEWRMGEMTLDPESIKNRIRFLIWFVDICKLFPAPKTLNLFSAKQMFDFLSLLPDDNSIFTKEFSPAVVSMRDWLINRMEQYMIQNEYGRDYEFIKKLKEEINA